MMHRWAERDGTYDDLGAQRSRALAMLPSHQPQPKSSYSTPINQLTYLEHLPATNDTPAQQADAHSDVQALDSFFGTPGLMS